MDKVPLFWRGVVCEPYLGTVVVADSLAHLRFRFLWWPIKNVMDFFWADKTLWPFFLSAVHKAMIWGPVF